MKALKLLINLNGLFHCVISSAFLVMYGIYSTVVYLSAHCVSGGLASRVKRKDTLALKLERQEREEKDSQESDVSTSWNNREQWEELRNRIGTTLNR